MFYNKRYSICVYTTSKDCYIYDNVDKHTVDGILFPSERDARRYLRNELKQRPCKPVAQ